MAPFSATRAGETSPIGLPSSPPVMRLDDLILQPFSRYWKAVRLVSESEVRDGAVPEKTCLFAFAPVTWLGPDSVRITVAESQERPPQVAERFVFLARRDGGWRVTAIETGMQS
ncbi:MAG TPA: hypothetical protein VFK13_14630 [Gemmatimonadaceae bacterium]|nr:hypothetical protein [Gemmatimonadaceae bacterium]